MLAAEVAMGVAKLESTAVGPLAAELEDGRANESEGSAPLVGTHGPGGDASLPAATFIDSDGSAIALPEADVPQRLLTFCGAYLSGLNATVPGDRRLACVEGGWLPGCRADPGEACLLERCTRNGRPSAEREGGEISAGRARRAGDLLEGVTTALGTGGLGDSVAARSDDKGHLGFLSRSASASGVGRQSRDAASAGL